MNTTPGSGAYRLTITSLDVALVESLAQKTTPGEIDAGRPRKILGAAESLAEIILTVIRDVDLGVLAGLITELLWQAKRSRPTSKPGTAKESESSPPADPAPASQTAEKPHISARLRIHSAHLPVDVELDLETDDPRAAEKLIATTLRNARLNG